MVNEIKVDRILATVFGVVLLGLGLALAIVAGVKELPSGASNACIQELKANKNMHIGIGSTIAVLGAIILGFLMYERSTPHLIVDRILAILFGLVLLGLGIALVVVANTKDWKLGLNDDCSKFIKGDEKNVVNAVGGVTLALGVLVLGTVGYAVYM